METTANIKKLTLLLQQITVPRDLTLLVLYPRQSAAGKKQPQNDDVNKAVNVKQLKACTQRRK